MKNWIRLSVVSVLTALCCGGYPAAAGKDSGTKPLEVYPIGRVEKEGGRTTIVVDETYEGALLGLEKLDEIWVLWWFDRNDRPEKRATLRVHPRGDPANPLTGVFATRSPVRPNLIGLTCCKLVSVKGNVIEIEEIDAFPGSPVLDIKSR